MKRTIQLWLARWWRWYRYRAIYVIADPRDNSVTLSRVLFNHMDVMNQEQAKVHVFRLTDLNKSGAIYAFALNPPIEEPTQLADIQYNSKHKCIGFECLVPTVNRIFYDYGLPHNKPARLSVEPCKHRDMSYYIILPPHDKHPE